MEMLLPLGDFFLPPTSSFRTQMFGQQREGHLGVGQHPFGMLFHVRQGEQWSDLFAFAL